MFPEYNNFSINTPCNTIICSNLVVLEKSFLGSTPGFSGGEISLIIPSSLKCIPLSERDRMSLLARRAAFRSKRNENLWPTVLLWMSTTSHLLIRKMMLFYIYFFLNAQSYKSNHIEKLYIINK